MSCRVLPTIKKKKAYKNLSSALEGCSNDFSFTFWSLCNELDPAAFSSNFLIPHIKAIEKKLIQNSDKKTVKAFIDMLKPAFVFSNITIGGEKNTDEHIEEIGLVSSGGFSNSLLNFLGFSGGGLMYRFINESAIQQEIAVNYKKRRQEGLNDNMLEIEEELLELLVRYNLINEIKIIISFLNEKRLSLEREIQRNANSIDDFINN